MSCSAIVVSPFEVRERHSVAVPFVKLSPLVRENYLSGICVDDSQ